MSFREPIGANDHVGARPHVHAREFDGDLILLDLEVGEYFALGDVGARMWHELAQGKTPREVAAKLVAEFDATEDDITRDCVRLVEDLLRRGLLERRSP
jgi:hypothetical protein